MAFVSDTESSRKDSSLAAHLLRRKRQRGLIRGCEEGKGRHCSTKRIERLWARGCLMPQTEGSLERRKRRRRLLQ
ncbi:hypothetical protein TNCV_1613261 [Trichonephila clavipes]|nr:hypothetical protein TNCV_1613261 [Trichonephila clavipes]